MEVRASAQRVRISPRKARLVVDMVRGKKVTDAIQLMKFVPPEFRMDAHHWLILHGRYTCMARNPQCWNCMIADLCEYKMKTPRPDKAV